MAEWSPHPTPQVPTPRHDPPGVLPSPRRRPLGSVSYSSAPIEAPVHGGGGDHMGARPHPPAAAPAISPNAGRFEQVRLP